MSESDLELVAEFERSELLKMWLLEEGRDKLENEEEKGPSYTQTLRARSTNLNLNLNSHMGLLAAWITTKKPTHCQKI